VKTILACLEILAPLLRTIKVNKDKMHSTAESSFILATDIAEHLVAKGMPFRRAHAVVREMANYCREMGKGFKDLSLEELRTFCELFDESFLERLTAEASVKARRLLEQVQWQITEAKKLLGQPAH
jgi:argininosuccinate lyase